MLTGHIRARSQKDAIEQARQRAIAWYGTECVSVMLVDPHDESEELGVLGCGEIDYAPVFATDYHADEWHQWSQARAGARCTHCGVEWS